MEDENMKYRNYEGNNFQRALHLVKNEGKTIYSDSKQTGVPWSTIKRYIQREDESLRSKAKLRYNDWECGACVKCYSDDVKEKNGAE